MHLPISPVLHCGLESESKSKSKSKSKSDRHTNAIFALIPSARAREERTRRARRTQISVHTLIALAKICGAHCARKTGMMVLCVVALGPGLRSSRTTVRGRRAGLANKRRVRRIPGRKKFACNAKRGVEVLRLLRPFLFLSGVTVADIYKYFSRHSGNQSRARPFRNLCARKNVQSAILRLGSIAKGRRS